MCKRVSARLIVCACVDEPSSVPTGLSFVLAPWTQEVFHKHGIPITGAGTTSRFVVDLAPELSVAPPEPSQVWQLQDAVPLDTLAKRIKLRTRNASCVSLLVTRRSSAFCCCCCCCCCGCFFGSLCVSLHCLIIYHGLHQVHD